VRRLKSEYDALPQRCLVRCSRGKGLDRDSPVLLIRMETTRAKSLWQAADMRPEPEKNKKREEIVVAMKCVARVWVISNISILTNVGARRAWGNAPSDKVLSRVLSFGVAGYSLQPCRGTDE
ncbi:hypothetical protein J3E71DRAFT_187436, partial [Bipolaris maydis]